MSDEAYYNVTKIKERPGYWLLQVFDKQENLLLSSEMSETRLERELDILVCDGCLPLAEKWLNDVYGVSFGGAQ
jgi:hypothetical protein